MTSRRGEAATTEMIGVLSMSIRLVLIDDHPLMLEGLSQLLSLESHFEVAAKCTSVAAGVRAIESVAPDVVVLDLRLRNESGLSVLRYLNGRPAPAVIVLTASENEEDLLESVRLGAKGVVLKAMAARTLERSIRAVHGGGEWLVVEGENLAQRVARRQVVESRIAERLTRRELEIMHLVATGYENDDIAERLGLGVGTVKIHVHHIYAKLRVSGRADLLEYLKRKGY